jgi:transposase
MAAAIAITRLDLSASTLRAPAGKEKNGAAARRMLALAMVLDGADRTTAANTCGMDRQTPRDWVHRYNEEGLAGMRDRAPPGARPKLTAAQKLGVGEACRGRSRSRRSRRGALAAR